MSDHHHENRRLALLELREKGPGALTEVARRHPRHGKELLALALLLALDPDLELPSEPS